MQTPRTVDEVLRDVRDALDLTRRGWSELRNADGRQRVAGIRNMVVWGRIVTLTLQNLRTLVREQFDEWYFPWQAEMKADGGFRYLYDLRNQIEKEGYVGRISSGTYVESFGPADMERLNRDRPANAKGLFFGDQWGGNGWVVQLSDGQTEKIYVQLPDDILVLMPTSA